jgi:hypothetical protein
MSKGWEQHAIGSCYFYSGVPSLMGNFRDRYWLAISRGGRLSRFSFLREQQLKIACRSLRRKMESPRGTQGEYA